MKSMYKVGEIVVDDFGLSKVIEVDENGTATAQRIMTKDMIVEMFHKFITTELDEDILQKFLNKREMSIVTNEFLYSLMNHKPQHGEWIDHSDDYGYVECPFCHELTNCDGNPEELHYCWNCGADMKGGAE